MEHHDLEQVLERAHRASVQLMTVAGLVSGLLLGIGLLGVQAGNLRFAIAMWAVAGSVAVGLAIGARHLRASADSVTEIGLVALDARAHVSTIQASVAQRMGELQSQVQRLQADVDRYVRTPPADAGVATPTPPPTGNGHAVEPDLEPTAAIDTPA